MATSKSITWFVTDIINWSRSEELIINENFQRRSVWTPSVKTLLIDSILNMLPVPKIFIRTLIDAKKQKPIREIVDGQQCVRSIVEFANNNLVLNNKSGQFKGMRYSDLPEENQQQFLSYPITAEHLLNATDDDVIDIEGRLMMMKGGTHG